MSRIRTSAKAAAIAIPLVGGFEGLRQAAYPDPATRGEPWTICYGHTGGVHRGDRATLEQCRDLLLTDLDRAGDRLDGCIKVPVSDEVYVAVLSLAHNIGAAGACRSSVVRLINAGHTRAGCDYLLKYNRAAGVVFPGLTRRREAERALCLKGAG